MPLNSELKRKLEFIEKISIIYKKQYISAEKFKKQFNEDEAFLALKIFLDSYAHERQGAAAAYPLIALDCISRRFNNGNSWRIPTLEDADQIWDDYKEIAENIYNIGTNKNNNPLNKDNGVITIMAKEKIFHIANHIKDLIITNELNKAYKIIKIIRGVGPKITPFYLRDVADLAYVIGDKKKEFQLNNLHLLQPIDTWIRQTFKILFGENRLSDLQKAKVIVDKCKEAEVSSIDFNQGAWILGSQLAGSFGKLREVINSPELLNELIESKIKNIKSYIDILYDFKNSI